MQNKEKGASLLETAICIPLLIAIIFTALNFIPAIIQLNLFINANKSSARVKYFDCYTNNPENIFSSIKENNNLTQHDSNWEGSKNPDTTISYQDLTVTVSIFNAAKGQEYCIICSDFLWKTSSEFNITSIYPKPRGC